MKWTKNLIQSIQKNINEEYHIILGDDDYPLHEHLKMCDNISNISVTKGTGNLYWGGTINLCIDYLMQNFQPKDSDIIIFANNDVIIDNSTYSIINLYMNKNPKSIYHPRVFDLTGRELASGAIIKLWFPFIQYYPLNFLRPLIRVDTITGRFLVMNYSVFIKVGNIPSNLPHYGGDSDYSLKARELGIDTYMVRDSVCFVDAETTGVKISNKISLKKFIKSFSDIKSSHNLKYRYNFVRNHKNALYSFLIVMSMTFKTILRFLLKPFIK